MVKIPKDCIVYPSIYSLQLPSGILTIALYILLFTAYNYPLVS
jgi:hypothetical protein